MVVSSDTSVDKTIISMRKDKARILTIHNYLLHWDNYQQMDEQVVLSHILNVLDKAQLAVSRKEVRTCFDKYYKKEYHGERLGYLQDLYRTFNIKSGTVVESAQARSHVSQKTPVTGYCGPSEASESTIGPIIGTSTQTQLNNTQEVKND